MQEPLDQPQLESDDEAPPILGSWRTLYVLVMVLHFLLIGVLYWFTTVHA